MIMPKKKRTMIFAAIVSGIVLVAILLLMYVAFATDALKSSEELFGKYLINGLENTSEFIDTYQTDNLADKKYQSEANIKLNYIKDFNNEQNSSNSFNDLVLKVNSQTDENDKYDYKLITLYKNSEKIGKIEYAKDDDMYGIHLPGIRQFMCVKNENLTQLFDMETLTEEQKKYVKDTIPEFDFDLSEFKFTEGEKEQLINTYRKIVSENTSKSNYSKQNGALITFNKESIKVNTYTLTMKKEDYNNLKIKILEQLQKDEIILGKIDKIQNKINEFYSLPKDYKQEFAKKINDEIEEIRNNNIGQEEVKMSVYAKDGKTKRIYIDDKTTTCTMDFIENNSTKTIKISTNKPDIVADSTEITLTSKKENNENEYKFYFQKVKAEDIDEFEISLTDNKQENNIHKNYNISYNDENNKITFNIEDNIEFVDDITKNDNFENNKIIINDVNEAMKKRIFDAIKDKGGQQLDFIYGKIQLKDLEDIISIFDSEEKITLENVGITQKDKQMFNSQFEFYQGNEIAATQIVELLDAVKENTNKVEIISKDRDNVNVKISVEKGKDDSEGIRTAKEVFENREFSYNKYNVIIKYSEQGIVNEILITYNRQ
ncbi:MAG: hypothetical protein IJH39_02800 [Clostridia bacterium]|nr:hypothetical protein [Clostridia bacterium]